jgi:hypothetical protein
VVPRDLPSFHVVRVQRGYASIDEKIPSAPRLLEDGIPNDDVAFADEPQTDFVVIYAALCADLDTSRRRS